MLDAKIEALFSYAQMPEGGTVPPEHADRIMHAHLAHPDFAFMAEDTPPGVPFEGIKGAMLALTYTSADEARRIFAALAEDSTAPMPLGESFWAEAFGMVTNRFSTPWGINGGPKAMGPT